MHRIQSAFLYICVLLASFTFSAAAGVKENLDNYLQATTELGRFSGAILVAKGNQIILRKGFGFADVERRIPYSVTTRHKIGSISKMFTAMAVLKLRESKKLNLKDPICRYIENCPGAWKPVRISNLLRHNSGIADLESKWGREKYQAFTGQPKLSEKLLKAVKLLPLEFAPGTKFQYSNTGYVVLAKIVARVSATEFTKFVTGKILGPAGMKSSGYIKMNQSSGNFARGYTHGNLGWKNTLAGFDLAAGHLQIVPQTRFTSVPGPGGLYSTIDDLYRWSKIMNGSNMVSRLLAKEVYDPKDNGYGLGWFVRQRLGEMTYSHNGVLPGYLSMILKKPARDLTIILFSNLDRVRLSSIVNDLQAIAIGKPFDMPVYGNVTKLSNMQISRLVGEYRTTDGRRLSIRSDPEMLIAEIKDQYEAGLIPLSPTEFYFPLADGKVVFTLGKNGMARSVNMRFSGKDHPATRVSQ